MCTELFCKKKTWFSALFFWRYVWHLTMLHTLTCIKIMIYLSVFWQKVDGMGWLWLVGSFKLHVSFAEYSLVYRARLQKRPVILRSLLIVAIPFLFRCSTCRDVHSFLAEKILCGTYAGRHTHAYICDTHTYFLRTHTHTSMLYIFAMFSNGTHAKQHITHTHTNTHTHTYTHTYT